MSLNFALGKEKCGYFYVFGSIVLFPHALVMLCGQCSGAGQAMTRRKTYLHATLDSQSLVLAPCPFGC